MWKKPENEKVNENELNTPRSEAWVASDCEPRGEHALLGPSLIVEGTVSGSEDLIIQGKVKGTVDLKKNIVTVGKQGRIEADIFARIITIEGEVTGNLHATEKVLIHKSGFVRGNVVCPRVMVEDGARLKGSIDVDAAEAKPEAKKDAGALMGQSDKDKPASGIDKSEKRPNGPMSIVM